MSSGTRTQPQPRRWWFSYPTGRRHDMTYWVLYALSEPLDFAYCAPRRIGCRLLGWHSATCDRSHVVRGG